MERTMTTLSMDFQAPLFYCPIMPALHPAVEEIEQRAVEWIDHWRICRSDSERARVIGTNSAEFYCRFAPAGVEENVLVATLWVYWGFAFDDACCDSGPFRTDPAGFLAMAGKVQRAMDDSAPSADPYGAALQDIIRRMRACATPGQVRRFIEAHRHWLYCVAWQIGNEATGRMPDLSEYLAMRLGSSGGPPTLALLEIANGREVPGREMDSPVVRALTEMAALIAALDNDLHSYRKEAEEAHSGQNIVNVLMHHEHCSLEQAVTRAVAIRDRMMTRFLRLRQDTLRQASGDLACYLECLGHAIRGNIDWAARVPRYFAPNATLGEQKSGVGAAEGARAPGQGIPAIQPVMATVTDEPHDTSTEPLEVPGISWWWWGPLAE
jgi:Terpene synthase family 2, C-terminal metal binding